MPASPSGGVTVNRSQNNTFVENLQELWQARPLIRELVRREVRTRYKNSVGGVAWSMVPPVVQIVIITFMVRQIWNSPMKNYSAYIFGLIFLWTYFMTAVMDGASSIAANAEILRKVYLPRAIFPLMALFNSLIHFGIGLVLTFVFFFVVRTYPEQLHLRVLLIVPVIFFMSVLALGISLIVSYSSIYYADVRFIVTNFLNLGLYSMPIFYPIEKVYAHPSLYRLYMLNPLAGFMVTYQRALMPPPPSVLPPLEIPWGYFIYACALSMVVLVVGFALFERNQWEVVEKL